MRHIKFTSYCSSKVIIVLLGVVSVIILWKSAIFEKLKIPSRLNLSFGAMRNNSLDIFIIAFLVPASSDSPVLRLPSRRSIPLQPINALLQR